MNISNAELEVLTIIWELQPCTADEIVSGLNETSSKHEKTAKTLINRLLKKQAISFQKNGRQYVYSAAISQSEYQANATQSFVSQIFNGRVSNLVATFANKDSLSEDDVSDLKKIISDWEQKQ